MILKDCLTRSCYWDPNARCEQERNVNCDFSFYQTCYGKPVVGVLLVGSDEKIVKIKSGMGSVRPTLTLLFYLFNFFSSPFVFSFFLHCFRTSQLTQRIEHAILIMVNEKEASEFSYEWQSTS